MIQVTSTALLEEKNEDTTKSAKIHQSTNLMMRALDKKIGKLGYFHEWEVKFVIEVAS